MEMLPMQPGDVETTYADIERARRKLNYEPSTPIEVGLPKFVAWYRSFHSPEAAN
jgi:UDP-glucuronate 4-epimerase